MYVCVLLHRTFLACAQTSLKFCILVSFMGTEKGWDAQLFLRFFCWWWWWMAPKRVGGSSTGSPLRLESEWAAASLGFRFNFSGLNSLESALSLRPLYA